MNAQPQMSSEMSRRRLRRRCFHSRSCTVQRSFAVPLLSSRLLADMYTNIAIASALLPCCCAKVFICFFSVVVDNIFTSHACVVVAAVVISICDDSFNGYL